MKACCGGSSLPFLARPSTVWIERPSIHTASCVQEYIALPSISTVHAPHSLRSQPSLVPVRSRCSRSSSLSVQRSSTSTAWRAPLMVNAIFERGAAPVSPPPPPPHLPPLPPPFF